MLRRNAYVRLADGELHARFGFFAVRTPLANVERWEISGSYKWWRAIGLRGTIGKGEMTFGGSAHGGVALSFRRPIRRLWWYKPIAVLYLTVDDLHGFAAELARRGIPGRDARG